MSGDPRGGVPPAAERAGAAASTGRRGVAGFVARHRTGVLAGALTAVFLLLAGGSLTAGILSASASDTPHRKPGATAAPTARPTPGALADPARVRTCSVGDALESDGLPQLRLQVREGPAELLSRRSGSATEPGALLQIVTGAAALAALGSDTRIETDVLDAGSGTVALVGHGDPTLSATPAGKQSVYADAPKLADLASATVAAFAAAHPGEQITAISLDSTAWSTQDAWNSTWDSGLRAAGDLSAATALQVDGDRRDPTQQRSPRGEDPVADAGAAFAAALKAADPDGAVVAGTLTTSVATSPATGEQLAAVQSQPIGTLVGQMLSASDGTLAEMLARLTSLKQGGGGSAASIRTSAPQALADYGIPTDDLDIADGSGWSSEDRLSMSYLSALMQLVGAGDQGLGVIRSALATAGTSGSLAQRFQGDAAPVQGQLIGIAGAPESATTMAGILTARDGASLAFAVSASGGDADPLAVDDLLAAIYRCGDNLAPR